MPAPNIAPAAWAAGVSYTVTNTGFAAIDINMSEIDEEPVTLVLTIPAGATVSAFRNPANWSGAGTSIRTAGAWIGMPVMLADWEMSVTPGGAVTDPATLSVTSAMSGAGGLLRIVIDTLADQAATIEPGSGTLSIDRVLIDPHISNVQVASGTPVRERKAVQLSANVAHTVVQNGALPAAPALVSAWTYDVIGNTLAIPDFASAGMTATFTAPAAYQQEHLHFTITAGLDLNASGTITAAEPQSSAPLQVDVETVRYGLVLVMDRSGSMGDTLGGGLSKWDAAVKAAHGWTDLFRAFRPGNNHLAGVVTFEHDGCAYTPTPAGNITFRDPVAAAPTAGLVALSGLAPAANAWNLGPVASCTPIGDALVKAWQGIGASLGPDDVGAVILMTDGYENSGTVTLTLPTPAGTSSFASVRGTGGLQVPNTLIGNHVYTLAIGTSVNGNALNNLGSAYYQQISNDITEVKPAFAAMLGHVLDAQEVMAQPALGNDPDPHANSLYYPVSAGEQVLAFLVTWNAISDSLRIGWRPQSTPTASFTVIGNTGAFEVHKRGTHCLVRVDLKAMFPGNAVPATEWRLQHLDNASNPLPLPVSAALVMVDLVTKAEVTFDKRHYYIGDPIRLTCKIRSGGLRVTGASVGIDSARPGEGLGTFLTVHAPRYKNSTQPPPGPDPLSGKGLMFVSLLHLLGRDDLTSVIPPDFKLFDDGAHGDGEADNGDYSNIFADTPVEGTYTFRFRIEGTLPDGSRYSRIFIRSTWVGVNPNPAWFNPVWATLEDNISILTIKPATASGEFLGPYQGDVIRIVASIGTLDGVLIDHHDGTYSQRIKHDPGLDPLVQIWVHDELKGSFGPRISPLAPYKRPTCWELLMLAIRNTFRALRKLLTGK